ncbi:MAG: type II/IV secretion system ATPase subunit [Dehalococcoidales bacterium]
MPKILLPFPLENEVNGNGEDPRQGDLYKSLPSELKKVVDDHPHLLDYLNMVPISKVGIPNYCPELSRKMGDDKKPNYIYPTNHADIFTHILFNPDDNRNSYIPIEPTLILNLDPLLLKIENKLLELGNKLAHIGNDGDREKQLLEAIDLVTTQDDLPSSGFFDEYIGFLRRSGNRLTKIKLTQRELESIRYLFIREKLGLGILEPLTADPYIEDISCSGLGNIFIEHKIFKSVKSTITFSHYEDLDQYILKLAERIKKRLTYKTPIADATLPDGSRINIVFGQEVSRRGSNFSIRKFSGVPVSIFELVDFRTLNYQILAYLSLVIGNGMSLFVSGETASGKTTMLNALTTFIHPMAKVVSIEDTPELQVPHKNWIREVVQSTKEADASGAVTMFDLLKAALRQRPDEILIGEIRGVEGNVAFQAMQTGHSVMATFHAASVEKLIQRITGNPISVPKTYIDNLNVVILTSMVKLPDGKAGRRITSIAEIVGYDPALDSFTFIESFHWDEANDIFEFTGNMTSYLLENVIAPRLGIPSRKKQRIYAELQRRAKILSKLHQEQGVTGFYEILEVLGKAQREGLF